MKKIGALALLILLAGSLRAQVNPYLQTPTPTSIYISWHSTDISVTKVRYGLTASNLDLVETGSHQNISGKIWHTVKLTGLTPDTRYYYRCISGVDSSAVYPFRSQPAPGTAGRHVRFVIFGDSRYNDTIPSILGHLCENVQQTLQTKYGSTWYDSVNLVMHTGDIVWRGTQIDRFQTEYFSLIANLSCSLPFMVAIGNHEHESANYFDYMKYEDFTDSLVATTVYNERFYTFDIAGVRFVVLNSNDKIIGAPMQKNWLNKVLTQADSDPGTSLVFPFAHHPWHTEIWTEGNTDSVKIAFFREFVKFYKVVQYSYGHAHDFELGAIIDTNSQNVIPHDLRINLAGGGGAELTRFFSGSHDYPEIQETVDDYNYVLIDVDVDHQSYTAEAFTLGKPEHPLSQLLDTWHFRMNQPPPGKPVAFPATTDPVILSSTPMTGVDSCMSSQFEITHIQGNYSSPVLDILRDREDIFENTGAPDFIPVNKNEGIDLTTLEVPDSILVHGTNYWYRARYRDDNLKWSPWSDEVSFQYLGINDLNYSSRDFTLNQNYPNPFGSKTNITFTIAKTCEVKIVVFDLMGREVKTLLYKTLNPGFYESSFDGSSLSGGVYFYKFSAGDHALTKKMMLNKVSFIQQ